MVKKFLDSAYQVNSPDETKDLYKDWAASYDEEVGENGYASPERTARALLSSGADLKAPLLDLGCGTGVSGMALQQHGFQTLIGADFSEDMLARAREKGIYRELFHANAEDPYGFLTSKMATITAIGVFSPAHAPASVIPQVLEHLESGGFFGFTLNDHALEDSSYLQEVHKSILEEKTRLRWQGYGPHLPKIGMKSMVIVLEKR